MTINGEPFEDIVGAPKESFKKRIPIDPDALVDGKGTMVVKIEATDAEGQTFDTTFQVDLAPVTMDGPESRMVVAVLAFAGDGVD